ncbi:cytochrome P450 [Sorangium sp. So ce375]|uniref:cytochrome P450 n=1 Tax=Sorangium sp. So ce375 TaxID=3133306 RepID=UPI003F5B2E36
MDYDPFAPAVQRDPYPYYTALRLDAPVHRLASRGFWVLSRHEDVSLALKRPDVFSSSIMAGRKLAPSETLLGSDPPAHTRLRRRVERAFSPRRMRELEDRLATLARELVGDFAPVGSCDVMAELAAPFPIAVIAGMLGVHADHHSDFRRWADDVIAHGTGRVMAGDRGRVEQSIAQFEAFLRAVLASRRGAPGDDLIGALVREDSDGSALSPEQALDFTRLLVLGGSETATNLIGNALLALFEHPGELDRVRRDRSLVPALVEETLRYDAPVQILLRRATRDIEIRGSLIPAGATTLLLLGSANRDEAIFPDADRFLLGRDASRHLAFGLGHHFCLGAQLARMEARIALDALLDLPGLQPAPGEIERIGSFVLRGPRALPLRFDARGPHG